MILLNVLQKVFELATTTLECNAPSNEILTHSSSRAHDPELFTLFEGN